MDEMWTEAPWRTRDGDYVNVKVGWMPEGGRWECGTVSVSWLDRPLDPGVLRGLPWGSIMAQHSEYLAMELDHERMAAEEPEVLEQVWSRLAVWAVDDEERKYREDMAAKFRAMVPEGKRRRVELEAVAVPSTGTPGRPRLYDEDHFRAIAALWREAHSRRENPTKAVADAFHVSRSTAAKWVSRARHEHHLLPATTQGRPGGIRDDTTRAREGAEGSGE